RGERPEDMGQLRILLRLGIAAGANRSAGPKAPGYFLLPDRYAAAGRRGQALEADHRRRGVLRSVLQRRQGRERQPCGPVERRLADRANDAGLRTGRRSPEPQNDSHDLAAAADRGREEPEEKRPDRFRRSAGAPATGPRLRRDRGNALWRIANPLAAGKRAAAGSRIVDREIVLFRIRQAVSRMGDGDNGSLRRADRWNSAGAG